MDISKIGKIPYKRLERPESKKKSSVHVKRYFSGLLERVFSVFIPACAFIVPVWVLDFNLVVEASRFFVWLAFSGFAAVIAVIIFVLRADLGILPNQSSVLRQGTVFRLALFAVVAFSLGTFISGSGADGFGLSDLNPNITVLSVFAGIVWLCVFSFVKPEKGFVKSVFVSWFLGSTVLAAYCLARLFFAGGYESVSWMVEQGWIIIFTVNVFLLLSFAMFQKRNIKLIWTLSIILHLSALFAWDAVIAWLVILAGISALLLFQTVYAKKLWQRNFTYPLQIWVIVFLLLIIPVKLFTGKSVPEAPVFAHEDALNAVSSLGLSFFGSGLSTAEHIIGLKQTSFLNFEDTGQFAVTDKSVGSGYLKLYIETGLIGVLALFLLIGTFLAAGVRFLKQNFDSLKEGTMPEAVYLGSLFFVALLMFCVGIWFSPFSVYVYWFLLMLLGGSFVFWSDDGDGGSLKDKKERVFARFSYNWILRLFGLAVVFAYVVFVILIVRIAVSAKEARELADASDPRASVEGWRSVIELNPRNSEYAARLIESETQLLGLPISLDKQRDAIEHITSTLIKYASRGDNPLWYWFGAATYARLQEYAEGSSVIAYDYYQKAQKAWPNNVALPVASAKFYGRNIDNIVSKDISAHDIRLEAQKDLQRALSLAPEYLPARLELAFLIEKDSDSESAIRELEPWEDASPEIKYHVGRLYFNKGDFETASEKFTDVIRDIPNHSNARYSLGISYFRLEKYNDALAEFEEVLRLNPSNNDVEEKISQVKKKIE